MAPFQLANSEAYHHEGAIGRNSRKKFKEEMKIQHGDYMLRWCWRKSKEQMKIQDWTRVAHSAKVGLALVMASLCALLSNVHHKLGNNAPWAILTVVLIFENTAGATISKGLNRGMGTIMAALLGLLVDYMSNFVGAKAQPFVMGFSVFVVGVMATYTRFVPSIKAKHDYGVMVFLLTFCLVALSGYRVSHDIEVTIDRIITVLLGVFICLIVSIFVFPKWAGDDLHNLVIHNFEGLAGSLEESLKEYFQGVQTLSQVSIKICKDQPRDDKIYKGYRGVLISKHKEETLASFARWEPRRGRFGNMYPWQQFVEVGTILRHCAYTMSSLHGCVLSEIQAPESSRKVFAPTCLGVAEEVAKVLRGVASDLKAFRRTKSKHDVLKRVHLALEDLHYAVRTYPHYLLASSLQNPNSYLYAHSPNYTSPLQEPSMISQAPIRLHDLQTPSYDSSHPITNPNYNPNFNPNPNINGNPNITQFPTLELASFLHPSSNPMYTSHQNSFPSSSTKIYLIAYPLHNPNPHNYPNSCIDIQLPSFEQISRPYSNLPINPSLDSNLLDDIEPTTPTTASVASTKGDLKVNFMLHGSMDFADSLSLASLITLLIDIVASVEHLLDVNAKFQEQACFQKLCYDDEQEELASVAKKVEVKCQA